MTIDTSILLENIRIDDETEPWYSKDQMFIRTPIVFPTVQFELIDTTWLNFIADKIVKQNKGVPCYDESGEFDAEAYYRFRICVYGVLPGIENCITFTKVDGWGGESDEYEIELTDEQRELLLPIIDEQCLRYIGKSVVELLQESATDYNIRWDHMLTE